MRLSSCLASNRCSMTGNSMHAPSACISPYVSSHPLLLLLSSPRSPVICFLSPFPTDASCENSLFSSFSPSLIPSCRRNATAGLSLQPPRDACLGTGAKGKQKDGGSIIMYRDLCDGLSNPWAPLPTFVLFGMLHTTTTGQRRAPFLCSALLIGHKPRDHDYIWKRPLITAPDAMHCRTGGPIDIDPRESQGPGACRRTYIVHHVRGTCLLPLFILRPWATKWMDPRYPGAGNPIGSGAPARW